MNSPKIMKTLKYTMSFLAAIVLATAVKVSAGENNGANPFFASLSAATAAELPAKAAGLVSQADPKNLKQTTIDVVKAAVGLNPAAAPAIVGSIAQSSPAMVVIAAATAVSLVPDQAATIARAAAVAVPTKAGQIVEAICRVVPGAYQKVATAVAEVVPGAGREILTAVSTAIPTLKDSINTVLASYNGNVPSVSSVLAQVTPSIEVAPTVPQATTAPQLSQPTFNSPSLAPPTFGAPYVPTPVSHINVDPGTGTTVPANGRNYAAP
jgi:hypothetical protein